MNSFMLRCDIARCKRSNVYMSRRGLSACFQDDPVVEIKGQQTGTAFYSVQLSQAQLLQTPSSTCSYRKQMDATGFLTFFSVSPFPSSSTLKLLHSDKNLGILQTERRILFCWFGSHPIRNHDIDHKTWQ